MYLQAGLRVKVWKRIDQPKFSAMLSFLHSQMVECWNMDFSVCCQVSFFLRFSSWKMRKIAVLKVNWCLQIWWIYRDFPWHKRFHLSWYPHMGRFVIQGNLKASKHTWRWRKPPEQHPAITSWYEDCEESPIIYKVSTSGGAGFLPSIVPIPTSVQQSLPDLYPLNVDVAPLTVESDFVPIGHC